ncbi:hypothetical protein MicB006_2411 [Micromonospora sp. B006]|nr:hypothetical protein MicB006_2411 [Micromonospora sp. B006]
MPGSQANRAAATAPADDVGRCGGNGRARPVTPTADRRREWTGCRQSASRNRGG